MRSQDRTASRDFSFGESAGPTTTSDLEAEPASALFPNDDDLRRWDYFLGSALAAAQARVVEGPVTPTLDPSSIREKLLLFDFAAPRPLEGLIRCVGGTGG